MRVFANLLIGMIFGFGLLLGGMTNPAKVLNFLDFAGTFDPSLAFVMAGAVVVAAIGLRVIRARETPVLARSFELPTRRGIDARLIGGSVLFGLGWGLVGFCPGPAFASLGTGSMGAALFVAAMMAGFFLARIAGQSGVASPRMRAG
jgi:uncharacterized protein